MFQAAILTTKNVDLNEESRLLLAFGENSEFNKIEFLIWFANFGVQKLKDCISDDSIETMENIKNFLVKTVEGKNFDIDGLPDDYLLLDEDND